MYKNPLEQFELIFFFNFTKFQMYSLFFSYILFICLRIYLIYRFGHGLLKWLPWWLQGINSIPSFIELKRNFYIWLFLWLPTSNFLWLTLIILIMIVFFSKQFLRQQIPFFLQFFTFLFNQSFFFIKITLKDNLSIRKKSCVFLMYFLFIFILLSNLFGMLPYSITITSHFIFTLYYSLTFFIGINIIGILYQEENYFILFLPDGVPIWIIPILIIIEYLSYFARIFSLAIRLFANMMSGHVLIKILIGFAWNLITVGFLWKVMSIFPLIIIFSITGLELSIALLQSYVFIILLFIYLNDVINSH